MSTKATELLIRPPFFWFFTLAYSMTVILIDWFNTLFIRIYTFDVSSGMLVLPLSFLLIVMITETYGYRNAIYAIGIGFLFNSLFMGFEYLVIHLPSPEYSDKNPLFDQILTNNLRTIVAFCISYFCSEPLSALIMDKLRIMTNGRYLGLRFAVSVAVGVIVSCFMFNCIAYKMMSPLNMSALAWSLLCITIAGLPFSINLTRKLLSTS